MEQLMTEIR
jgi:L-asparagine transporter-like permease